jgi:hypothetical protein
MSPFNLQDPTAVRGRFPLAMFAAGAALAVSLAAVPLTAAAAPLVGTDPAQDDGGFGIGFSFDPNVNLVIAQQFGIGAAPATVGGISVWLNGRGVGQFTLQVMSAIGSAATASNVLLMLTGNLPNVTSGHQEVAFTGLNLALAAATDYYLVVSSAAGPDTGWGTTTGVLPGLPGTVGSSFVGIRTGGGVADYTFLDPVNTNTSLTLFRLDPVATVPVPSTFALAALGAAGLLVASRRRRNDRT